MNMPKTRKPVSIPLSVKIPSKRIREQFLLMYDLDGCIKAVNFLTQHYRTRRMKIVLDEKRVGNTRAACYCKNRAYFKKMTLKKRIVLHELYHHLIKSKGFELQRETEEKEARIYAREFIL
jgi:hypothetical protein